MIFVEFVSFDFLFMGCSDSGRMVCVSIGDLFSFFGKLQHLFLLIFNGVFCEVGTRLSYFSSFNFF